MYNNLIMRLEKSATRKSLRQGVQYHRIDEDNDGRRLDNYLIALFKGIPQSHIYRLIRSGQVRVNGGRIKPLQRLRTGDHIRIPPLSISAPSNSQFTLRSEDAEQLEAAVLYEDDDLLVLNKPSGLAAHAGNRCNFGLAEMFKQLRTGQAIPVPAHRLDRQTSGCLICAKNRPALLELHDAFRRATVKKTYLALLVGRWDQKLQDVSMPLVVLHGRDNVQVYVDEEKGKPARTGFELITEFEHWTLVRVLPYSGRMHQIRVHAAYCKRPIAQDNRYGDFQVNRQLEKMGLRRLFLHAEQVAFLYQGREMSYTAPLPEDLSIFLKQCNEADISQN